MTFEHDGIVFDLDQDYADVTGTVWTWARKRNSHGEPLMASRRTGGTVDANEPVVALPDLYHLLGPLIPCPHPTTAALYRRVLLGVAS